MSKIQLHVKSLTGGETVINCLNNITVYDLKKLINEDEPYNDTWATNISTGADNEDQDLFFTVTFDNPDLSRKFL